MGNAKGCLAVVLTAALHDEAVGLIGGVKGLAETSRAEVVADVLAAISFSKMY